MLISFIIPHKGREELLTETVASIANQNTDLSEVEVIIVTQNKELTSESLLSNNRLKISIEVRPESDTISALRNVGAKKSSADYFAFLDADVALSENWISAMRAELNANTSRVLVSAVQRCESSAPPLEKIRTALSNATTDSDVRFLPGRNLLLARETFDAAGGFPEHLVTCEDYYFTDKVHELGSLYYSSKATYVHLGEDKQYKEMFDKEIWRGQSNLQSIKGRPIPLSELPSFLVPVWVLLFSLSTILSVLTLNFGIASINLLLTLLPVFLYAIRLYRIADGSVSFNKVIQFYLLYFPARIIGTIAGLFKVINI
ncbi:glycosyl transferase family A [Gammaproteobacteria bacterium 45_16_T64]|nr:glycosyl transferase family A [Gammaproteobacteria bacterium 45_16_T64]